MEAVSHNIREILLKRVRAEAFSFDHSDIDNDCDEILQGYVEGDAPTIEKYNQENLFNALLARQHDKEYLLSLNLHKVIAKHVRISCRKACAFESQSIESWVRSDLKFETLQDEIAQTIRAAWKVRAPCAAYAIPKFSEELSFESLDKFHLGLENLIGYPPTHSKFLELMMHEHKNGKRFADQKGRDVDPKIEWNVVMRSDKWNIYGAGCEPTTEIHKRECVQPLDYYIAIAQEKFAKLRVSGDSVLNEAEVAALRLWTGPMHKKYAEVLRNHQQANDPYVTTLHAINSGITKLARIWQLPETRKVYRGYKGLKLQNLKRDAFQCVGGVEKCVFATSEEFDVAVNYSEDGAFILEIDVGQVNRGADVSWLSQFPHEHEILFNALSNVEFLCSPQRRFVEGRGTILVYRVCVSANVRSKTLEEFVRLQKDLHVNLVDVLTQEAKRMIEIRLRSNVSQIRRLCVECRTHCDQVLNTAKAAKLSIFTEDARANVSLVEDAIMLQSRLEEIFDVVVRWCECSKADPSELDRFQDWQLRVLRSCFKQVGGPFVETIVLDHDLNVHQRIFTAEKLDIDPVHKSDTLCKVAKLLSLNPNLRYLNIKAVSATFEHWEKVFHELSTDNRLICVNECDPAEYAIKTLHQLEHRNHATERVHLVTLTLLFHPPSSLTSLSLYGSQIACTGAETLSRAFSGLQRLKYANLCSCRIADRGCNEISRRLSALTDLEVLKLANNNVAHEGYVNLVAVIGTYGLTRLQTIDVRFNPCGSQCVIMDHVVTMSNARTTCLAWACIGDHIASGTQNNAILVWEAKTGKQVFTLNGHTSDVTSVSWSPEDDRIASGSDDKTIIIWDAKTGEQVSTLNGHSSYVKSVAWSPEGDRVASGSDDGAIIIWDAKTEEPVLTLTGHAHRLTSMAWSPEGDRIASGSNIKTFIWDAKTGGQILSVKGHMSSVAWSPEGERMATGSFDKKIIVWDTNSGDQISELKGHTSAVQSVAWSPKGDRIASGSRDLTIIVWDARTGDQLLVRKVHTSPVNSLSWSPKGDQLCSGSHKTIIVWNVLEEESTLVGHSKDVMSLSWSPTGDRIASGSCDQTIVIWDAKTGEKRLTLMGHHSIVKSLVWSPKSDHIASGSKNHTIIVWSSKTGEQVFTLNGHTSDVTSVSWSPEDDRIASGSDDKTIIIWDAKTGEQVSTLNGHSSYVKSVAWSPEGDRVASGSDDGAIIIWDAKTEEPVLTLKGHAHRLTSVAWSPEGDQIVSGSFDGKIIIWDAKTGDQVSTLKCSSCEVHSVAWSPNGTQIASAVNMIVIIWDARTGDQVSTLRGHKSAVLSVGWNPESDKVASGSCDTTIIIWDAKECEQSTGHKSAVTCVSWNPEEDQIASASDDKTIIIWDSKTWKPQSTLKGHFSPVTSVVWNLTRDRIASRSSDGAIIFWDSKTGEKISRCVCDPDFGGKSAEVAWSPDRNKIAIVSTSEQEIIIVVDTITAEQVSTLKGHSFWVGCIAWSSEGDQIASVAGDHKRFSGQIEVIIWDAKTWKPVSTYQWGIQVNVASSPSSDLLATDFPDIDVMWDAKADDLDINRDGQTLSKRGHRMFRHLSVHWSANSDQIAVSHDHTLFTLNPRKCQRVMALEGHVGPICSLAWCPDLYRVATGSADYIVIVWDSQSGQLLLKLMGHNGQVNSISWSPCGLQVVSASDDNTLIIWDANTGVLVSQLKGRYGTACSASGTQENPDCRDNFHNSYRKVTVTSGLMDGTQALHNCKKSGLRQRMNYACTMSRVAWSYKGKYIAYQGEMEAHTIVCDAKTGEQVFTLNGHTSDVTSVSWSPEDDRIASGSDDKTIIIWDAKTGEQVSTLNGHSSYVKSVAWSPEGDRVASGSDDGAIIIWDAKTEEQVLTFKGHAHRLTSMAWSPEGDRIASGSRFETIIWDAKTGEQILLLQGHTHCMSSLAWSPEGERMATGSFDKKIIVWDTKTGERVSKFKGHTSAVQSVAWSPKGDRIASGSRDQTIIVWDARTGEQLLTKRANASMSLSNIVWSPKADRIVAARWPCTPHGWFVWNVESNLNVCTEDVTRLSLELVEPLYQRSQY